MRRATYYVLKNVAGHIRSKNMYFFYKNVLFIIAMFSKFESQIIYFIF